MTVRLFQETEKKGLEETGASFQIFPGKFQPRAISTGWNRAAEAPEIEFKSSVPKSLFLDQSPKGDIIGGPTGIGRCVTIRVA